MSAYTSDDLCMLDAYTEGFGQLHACPLQQKSRPLVMVKNGSDDE
jgi:hypothetical protein